MRRTLIAAALIAGCTPTHHQATHGASHRPYRDPAVLAADTTTTSIERTITNRATRSHPTPRPTIAPLPRRAAIGGERELGQAMAAAAGWTGGQWACLDDLWGPLESGWNPAAVNGRSGAGGIPQALPPSKMGADWRTNIDGQIGWGLAYIRGRYGTPCAARAARLTKGWY